MGFVFLLREFRVLSWIVLRQLGHTIHEITRMKAPRNKSFCVKSQIVNLNSAIRVLTWSGWEFFV